MFESIINWIIANKDSLISNLVVTLFFIVVGKLWILKNRIPNAIKTLVNIKGIKYLGFIVVYILPLGTIAWMIVDKTNEPTFKNIALFIIICVSLIFNILIFNDLKKISKIRIPLLLALNVIGIPLLLALIPLLLTSNIIRLTDIYYFGVLLVLLYRSIKTMIKFKNIVYGLKKTLIDLFIIFKYNLFM